MSYLIPIAVLFERLFYQVVLLSRGQFEVQMLRCRNVRCCCMMIVVAGNASFNKRVLDAAVKRYAEETVMPPSSAVAIFTFCKE